MAALIDVTPVLGGGRIYRRQLDGPWHFDFSVEGEGRIRKSLRTSDKAFALREAERLTLDAKAALAAGHRVLAGSIGECLARYEEHQQERILRGEIRSVDNARYKVRFLRRVLGELFGLDRVISTLTQRDWDGFVPHRTRQGAALDTIRQECSLVRGFCRFSSHYGCQLIPELAVRVPKNKRSRRTETFTSREFHSLLKALDSYVQPETGEEFVRDWSLGSAQARQVAPKSFSQDLERSRRELLRWFVIVAASSGCRPHELAGDDAGSLRWGDVEFKKVSVKLSFSKASPSEKTIAILRIRSETKTGSRTVSMAGGDYLAALRAWSRFQSDDDYVFADQYGLRAGRTVYLDALRLHWREVLSRMKFARFKPDLYSLRHFFATERLAAGAPPYLIAKTLGHSLSELTNTYEHILMENEGVIRDVWRSNTPKELLELGVLVADRRNLAF